MSNGEESATFSCINERFDDENRFENRVSRKPYSFRAVFTPTAVCLQRNKRSVINLLYFRANGEFDEVHHLRAAKLFI